MGTGIGGGVAKLQWDEKRSIPILDPPRNGDRLLDDYSLCNSSSIFSLP